MNLPGQIMAYERSNGRDKVVVVLNLSNQPQQAIINDIEPGFYIDLFTVQNPKDIRYIQMKAWGYQVFVKQNFD